MINLEENKQLDEMMKEKSFHKEELIRWMEYLEGEINQIKMTMRGIKHHLAQII